MTNLSINGIELLAVNVRDVEEITIYPRVIGCELLVGYANKVIEIKLPSGEYEPLGLIKDISEEVAASIVGERLDYASIIEIYLPTFKESLSSLIKSKGLDSDFTYLLKKK